MMDPYVAAGLRHNPFVAEATPGVDAAVFLDHGIAAPRGSGVVEIVGCRGAGKTTHLLRWIEELGGCYHHVDPGWRRFLPIPCPTAVRRWKRDDTGSRPCPAAVGGCERDDTGGVAWDEVDRLPKVVLRALVARARRAGALVLLGTHEPTGLADVTHRLPAPTADTVLAFAHLRIAAADLGGTSLQLSRRTAAQVAADSEGCWWHVGTALHRWTAEVVTNHNGVPA